MYFVERGMNPARRPKGAPLWNPLGAPRGKAPRYSDASLNAARSEKFDSPPFIPGAKPQGILAGK